MDPMQGKFEYTNGITMLGFREELILMEKPLEIILVFH